MKALICNNIYTNNQYTQIDHNICATCSTDALKF